MCFHQARAMSVVCVCVYLYNDIQYIDWAYHGHETIHQECNGYPIVFDPYKYFSTAYCCKL